MTLSDLSIRRPVFAWMLMAALMIFGFISFERLGVSRLPDVDFPVVSVRLAWEGASPEVMESDVVDVVEEAVTSIQGIREISSSIRQGQASVSIELELERDIDIAVDHRSLEAQGIDLEPQNKIGPAASRKNDGRPRPKCRSSWRCWRSSRAW